MRIEKYAMRLRAVGHQPAKPYHQQAIPVSAPHTQQNEADLTARQESAPTINADGVASDNITPHPLFEVWSPDATAECLDGVDSGLYQTLWQLIPLYEAQKRSEVPDDFDTRALVRFWDHLSTDQQEKLNQLAVAFETSLGASSRTAT